MAAHKYHEELPNYHERQIWYDGCPECERRSRSVPNSIGKLDNGNLERAWVRMLMWSNDSGDVGPLSQAEMPLLRFLESVKFVNERLHQVGLR